MSEEPLERLRRIVARLRAPDGCPWDREQTHASLRTALVEETYEVLAAIEAQDDTNFCEELGDLLLHVVMHAQMASERGAFDFDDLARGIGEKMVRRHPHVFGGDRLTDSAAVLVRWDEIKRQEKARAGGISGAEEPSQLDGVPPSLPALMRAQAVQKKAAKVGFDWPEISGVQAKVHEEIAEVESATPETIGDEIGDLLFAAVNLARWHRLDAETALRQATDKFTRRFQYVESALRARGQAWETASFEELDILWNEAKATGQS